MKQVTISVPDNKYSIFMDIIQEIDYVKVEADLYYISEAQKKYVLKIKSKYKKKEMIEADDMFKEMDKKF